MYTVQALILFLQKESPTSKPFSQFSRWPSTDEIDLRRFSNFQTSCSLALIESPLLFLFLFFFLVFFSPLYLAWISGSNFLNSGIHPETLIFLNFIFISTPWNRRREWILKLKMKVLKEKDFLWKFPSTKIGRKVRSMRANSVVQETGNCIHI